MVKLCNIIFTLPFIALNFEFFMIDDSCFFSFATDLKMQSVDEQMNTMSLLNMQNIPDGMISGLSTEQLNWVTVQSNERTLIELIPNTFSDIDDFINNNDFKELSDTITSEMDMLEKESVPKGTQYNTEAHVKKFKNFLIDQKLSTEIETMPVKFLANYLRFFYFNLRCKDGTFYAPRSLIGIRASLHRYLTSCEVDRGINILKDKEFDRPNAILKAMVGKWIKPDYVLDKVDSFTEVFCYLISNFYFAVVRFDFLAVRL